jgi:hypothetical protein
VLALGPGNMTQWVRGEKTNTGRESVRLLGQNMPGGSNWYLRLAYERGVLDNLQRLVAPEAHAAFRRKIQMQRRDLAMNSIGPQAARRRRERPILVRRLLADSPTMSGPQTSESAQSIPPRSSALAAAHPNYQLLPPNLC